MPKYWIILFPAAWVASAVAPRDALTWFLEMLPAAGCFLGLWLLRGRFAFTPLTHALLLVLCLLILAGAHYSFAHVPGFDAFGGGRNQFDKFAHFFQGAAPALVFRECLIRFEVVTRRVWLWGLVPALCLALSAGYELVEWGVALWLHQRADDFLAIQGDPWDAQSDMAMALLGALVALALLHRFQDGQIARLEGETGRESPIRGLPEPRRPLAP